MVPGLRIDRVYVEMTARPGADARARIERITGAGLGTMLTHVSSNLLAGLIEAVSTAPYNGHADLPAISSDLRMEADELFPVEASVNLRHGLQPAPPMQRISISPVSPYIEAPH